MRVGRVRVLLGVAAVVGFVGCATAPLNQSGTTPLAMTEPQVEHGQPNRFVDGVGWVLGIPEKVMLWDGRAENHRVSAETEQSLMAYLAANGMESTKVRVNQYDP